MRPDEYLDPGRFPLTTKKGLTLPQQMKIDAFNYDSGKNMLEEGYQMTEEDRAGWAETEEKVAAHPELWQYLKSPKPPGKE
jgi:hypothetical protein